MFGNFVAPASPTFTKKFEICPYDHAHITHQLTIISTTRWRTAKSCFKMTGYKRVFLGCWVSLDEQDRLCKVSLDSSTVEVSGPSNRQIDTIFQACRSPMKFVMSKLLTYLLSVTIESRFAAREMRPLTRSSYSKNPLPLRSRLMLRHRVRALLNN